jgi:hypothetical protein
MKNPPLMEPVGNLTLLPGLKGLHLVRQMSRYRRVFPLHRLVSNPDFVTRPRNERIFSEET